jgi:hypothetical protein
VGFFDNTLLTQTAPHTPKLLTSFPYLLHDLTLPVPD